MKRLIASVAVSALSVLLSVWFVILCYQHGEGIQSLFPLALTWPVWVIGLPAIRQYRSASVCPAASTRLKG